LQTTRIRVSTARVSARDLAHAYLLQRPRLEGLARRLLGCPAAAADVAQEAWAHAAAAAPARDPAAFLHRIARNLALDRLRRQARGAAPLEPGLDPADPAPGPEQIAADRQTLARVQAAIDALPPRCREAFLLARIEGFSHAAIAARLGVSPRTVENHVALALLRLRHAARDGEP
jgi:RNA polymerase sigma factor (sigma-70 family)